MLLLFILLLIVLSMLPVVQARTALVSDVSGRCARRFERAGDALVDWLAPEGKPHLTGFVIGTVLALLMVLVVIPHWIPYYAEMLEVILSLESDVSRGLSTLLIVTSAALGVITHLAWERVGVTRPDDDRRHVRRAVLAKLGATSLPLAAAMILWLLGGLIAHEFYFRALWEHGGTARTLVPMIAGIATFLSFMAETIVFFVVSCCALPTACLLAVHGVRLFIWVVADFFRLLETSFACIRRTQNNTEER